MKFGKEMAARALMRGYFTNERTLSALLDKHMTDRQHENLFGILLKIMNAQHTDDMCHAAMDINFLLSAVAKQAADRKIAEKAEKDLREARARDDFLRSNYDSYEGYSRPRNDYSDIGMS